MSSLEELLRQKAELEEQIEKTRREQKAEAVATVLGIVRLHNLTLEDCGFRCPQIEAMDQGQAPPACEIHFSHWRDLERPWTSSQVGQEHYRQRRKPRRVSRGKGCCSGGYDPGRARLTMLAAKQQAPSGAFFTPGDPNAK